MEHLLEKKLRIKSKTMTLSIIQIVLIAILIQVAIAPRSPQRTENEKLEKSKESFAYRVFGKPVFTLPSNVKNAFECTVRSIGNVLNSSAMKNYGNNPDEEGKKGLGKKSPKPNSEMNGNRLSKDEYFVSIVDGGPPAGTEQKATPNVARTPVAGSRQANTEHSLGGSGTKSKEHANRARKTGAGNGQVKATPNSEDSGTEAEDATSKVSRKSKVGAEDEQAEAGHSPEGNGYVYSNEDISHIYSQEEIERMSKIRPRVGDRDKQAEAEAEQSPEDTDQVDSHEEVIRMARTKPKVGAGDEQAEAVHCPEGTEKKEATSRSNDN